jgi:restriction endonuclease Mrr
VAIPDFQTFMRPLLELASDGKERSLQEARENLAALNLRISV